jgi:hypothetical protein
LGGWTDTDLGVIDEQITLDVPARDSRVVILRPYQDRPYTLQSNRHVSQGATDIEDASWNAETQRLSWTQKVVKGFEHRVRVDASGFMTTPTLAVDGQENGRLEEFGELWSIELNAFENGSIKPNLTF